MAQTWKTMPAAAGINRGPWATGAAYNANDLVTSGGQMFAAKNNHVAGATFAADLAAHWSLYVANGNGASATGPLTAAAAGALMNNGDRLFSVSADGATILEEWVRTNA